MVLEHGVDLPSARWDSVNNKWDVGCRKKYRWCHIDNTPASDWVYSMQEALDWIIDYDSKNTEVKPL